MMEQIKIHFLKFGPRRFVWATVFLLFILDLINSWYLRIYWVHKNFSILFVKRIAQNQGLDLDGLGRESVLEVQQFIDNAFFFFLFIVLLNNVFFYIFYLRKKLWAQGYVLFYTLTNSILAITFLIEGTILGWNWFLYNLFTMFFYLYLYFGVKVLKYETTDAIPVDGKTAQ